MKSVKQVVMGLVWCVVSVGCVAEEAKKPEMDPPHKAEWKMLEGAEYPLCQSIFKLIGNKDDAEALHYSIDPLLKIEGVSAPPREEITGIEYYKIGFPDWADKKEADVVMKIEKKYPGTKWYRYKIDFDNNGADEYIIQEEIPNYKYDSRIYLLKDKLTIHPGSGNRYGKLFLYQGITFMFRQSDSHYAVRKIEASGSNEVLFSIPSYCNIERK